jgi:lipopolysaccharide/colanic/teichoic acid biosynthesis glycosyltransferase
MSGGYERSKRLLDLAVALPALVVSLPLQAAVAAAVAVKLGRPVLFRQVRPGLHGKPFELVKFRTMLPLDPARGLTSDGARLNSFGRALRSTSLDELPTLWNIVRGDLSLVGPRPLLVQYLPLYDERQARRHEVVPGLTGLAQVAGRNALSWERKLELDVEYVERRSLRLDLAILMATVGTVLRRQGISAPGDVTMPEFSGNRGPS